MRKLKFIESQIVAILNEVECGGTVTLGSYPADHTPGMGDALIRMFRSA